MAGDDTVIPMPNRQTIIGRLLEKVADQDNEIAELKEQIPVNLPASDSFPVPLGFGTDDGGLASMDVEAFFNMRSWLEDAITAKGAKVDGAGIGCGQADLSFELEGCRYSVSIRPLTK